MVKESMKKKTILFDLTAIYDHLTGIERYAINISREIITNHNENNYILLFKQEIHSSFEAISHQNNVEVHILPACHKLLFNQLRLMRFLYKCKADKYVFLSFVSPWLFKSPNIINTIHDISAWDCPGTRKWYMVMYGKIGIKNALRTSKQIVAVSEFTKDRLIKRLNVDSQKITVAYNGVSEHFLADEPFSQSDGEKILKKYNLPKKYILCLSTLEPRKNMKLLIEAFVALKNEKAIMCDLVLAGRKGWKLESVIGKEDRDVECDIHFTGFIEDEDLPYIYSKAEMFVFPSIYEGFGIPIIEAMACKTIVVSSDASSLPEVVGDAGILFANNEINSLKQKIIYVLNLSDEEKQLLLRKGQERSKMFIWAVEAEKYYKAILQ